MAVRKAQLVMEIDASGMKRGADEATTSIRRVETASAGAARVVAEHNRSVDKLWRDIEEGERRRAHVLDQSSTRVVKSSEEMKRSMLSMGNVAEIVERRFIAIGKAGVAMFAVDLVAKVAGFTSVLDALRQGSDALAESIRRTLVPEMERLASIAESQKKLTDEVERIRQAEQRDIYTNSDQGDITRGVYGYGDKRDPLRLTYTIPSLSYDLSSLTESERSRASKMLASLSDQADEIAKRVAENAFGEYSYENLQRPRLYSNEDAKRFAQAGIDNVAAGIDRSIREILLNRASIFPTISAASAAGASMDSLISRELAGSAEASRIDAGGARTSLADIPIARGLFGPTEGESSRFGIASGYTGNPWAGFGFPPYNGDRRGSIAASRGGRAQAGLEGYLYELESSRYTLPVDEPLPESSAYRDVMERVRQRDLERRGRIGGILSGDGFTGFGFGENEQTAMLSRRLGEDISYGIGEGIRTGDWGDAGRSIVQSIQSSLIQSLVAEPFADAAASLIQQLLAGMRGISLGSSGASPRQGAQDRARGLELP